MNDTELSKEDREFLDWLEHADEKTLTRIIKQTEKEIFRDGGKSLYEKTV